MTERKSAAAKKSGGKKTTAAPRGKRLSVTLDADTMALLEEYLAQDAPTAAASSTVTAESGDLIG